jgi:polysaccharide pyruvyl transferase WcaK-like protein
MASFIDRLGSNGHHVMLAPHSARPGAGAGRMNDLPVCRSIYERLANQESCTFIDDNLAPDELRALIGASVITVTSRFHAMISALATQTPVMVVGWSHKYQEVLDDFGVEGCAIDYPSLTVDELMERFADIQDRRGAIIASIERSLPKVREQSRVSYTAIAAAAGVHV